MKLADTLDFQYNIAKNIVLNPTTTTPNAVQGLVYQQTGGTAPTVSSPTPSAATPSNLGFYGYNGSSWVRLDNAYNNASDIIGLTAPVNGISYGTLVAGHLLTVNASGLITDAGLSAASVVTSADGDVTGTVANNVLTTSISAIKGNPVAFSTLSNFDVMVYSGGSIVNSPLKISLTGDVTASPTSMTNNASISTTVSRLLSKPFTTTQISSNGFVKWNSTSGWSTDSNVYLTSAITSINGLAGPSITLSAGPGLSASSASNTITLSNTGVTSIVAGNNIAISQAAGAVTVGTSWTPSFSSISINGSSLTYNATPTNSSDIITYGQVLNQSFGMRDFKESVYVATTVALAGVYASAGQTITDSSSGSVLTIDGLTVPAGARVLVKDMGTSNGIYVVTSAGAAGTTKWVLTRASDFNSGGTSGDISNGAYTYVGSGTVNGGFGFILSTYDPITLDTTPLTFVKYAGTSMYTNGTGLSLSNYQFSIANTTVTAGPYGDQALNRIPTFTVNAQGQLTAAGYYATTAITALGTITAGTWHGSTVGTTYGGTGLTATAGAGSILYGTSTTAYSSMAGNSTATKMFLSETSGVPSWGTIGTGDISNLGSWAGSTNITTVGTITTGTWHGSVVSTVYGGTGLSSYASGDMVYYSSGASFTTLSKGTANQIIGMNAAATAPEYKTVASPGGTVDISYTAGHINIDVDPSQMVSTYSYTGTFTFSSTGANTITANPAVFFNNTAEGGYLLQVNHNLNSVPTVVGIVDSVTGENYLASVFAATASAYNAGAITTANKNVSVIRLSANGITSLLNRTIIITLSSI